jgi:hypothetical protein
MLTLLAACTAACASSSQPGTQVQFVSSGWALAAGQTLHLGADEELRVDAMYWTNAELELVSCGSALTHAIDWWVPTAHAHGLSTPTAIAAPTVESAHGPGDTVLGELRPPAGEYCALRYSLGPADGDALGLAEQPEMLGKALLVRGALGSTGATLEPFELSGASGFAATLPLSLDLTRADPQAVVRLTRDAGAAFEQLSLRDLTPPEQYDALLSALLQIRLDVE